MSDHDVSRWPGDLKEFWPRLIIRNEGSIPKVDGGLTTDVHWVFQRAIKVGTDGSERWPLIVALADVLGHGVLNQHHDSLSMLGTEQWT